MARNIVLDRNLLLYLENLSLRAYLAVYGQPEVVREQLQGGYRQLTIGRKDRTATSLPEHLAIIEALEARDTELAEKRARDHTLGLASYVEAHGQELFT